MNKNFSDPRLVALNDEGGLTDDSMRSALCLALEPGEIAVANYHVSMHIWVEAVLTDRALLLVKGSMRTKVIRMPLPLRVIRAPTGTKEGVRIRTPIGYKTLWGSKADSEAVALLAATTCSATPSGTSARKLPDEPSLLPHVTHTGTRSPTPTRSKQDPRSGDQPPTREPSTRLTRREARRVAGPRPRKPRREHVKRQRVGFQPEQTIWDMADNCIKCGRSLTDPRSRQARVGTKCIKVYGTQERRIPNPLHKVWADKKIEAEVAYIAKKARVEAEFVRAKAAYERARAEWDRVRSAR